MAKEDIVPYQRNLELKRAFRLLELDLTEVVDFSPFNLDLENERLEQLLDFVYRYQKYGDRETMELVEGEVSFPPIYPGISPESDWYRFELWMQGQPIRMKLSEQLSLTMVLKKPETMTDDEIGAALEHLEQAMLEAGYGVCLHDGIPLRLVYDFLVETLGETFELDPGGCWHLDGCSGFCPDCFQRPWCDTGESSCWPEDEAAGKMRLVDVLKPYVCASPQSLEILKRLQAEEDANFARFKAESRDSEFGGSMGDEDWKASLN